MITYLITTGWADGYLHHIERSPYTRVTEEKHGRCILQVGPGQKNSEKVFRSFLFCESQSTSAIRSFPIYFRNMGMISIGWGNKKRNKMKNATKYFFNWHTEITHLWSRVNYAF